MEMICVNCGNIVSNSSTCNCGNSKLFRYYENDEFDEIVTHNGKMHTDDIATVSLLRILFPKAKIIRSRKIEMICKKEKRIVVDVGKKFDPINNLFDHHQSKRGRTVCINNNAQQVLYSAMGLIWEQFGHQIIFKIAKKKKIQIKEFMISNLYNLFLKRIVVPVDISDTIGNAHNQPKDTNIIPLQLLVNDFNGSENTDENFMFVSDFFMKWFESYIETCLISNDMQLLFEKDFDTALENKQKYCVLTKVGNWIRFVCGVKNLEKYKDILFVIYQDNVTGGWKIQGVPTDCSNRKVRMIIPSKLKEIEGVNFIHSNQFIAETNSLNSAIEVVNAIVPKI